MAPGARWVLPAGQSGSNRSLYFFAGDTLQVGGRQVPSGSMLELRAERETSLQAGGAPIELLMLQGRPIGEPVAQHGPFVMNTREEILQAFHDYQQTGFGGWPWKGDGPVHAQDEERHAKMPDGSVETADR